MCVLDEFSEYLPETRFNTSADFNTYPIRIFVLGLFMYNFMIYHIKGMSAERICVRCARVFVGVWGCAIVFTGVPSCF